MGLKKLLSKTKVFDIHSCMPDGVILITEDGNIQWTNDVARRVFFKDENTISSNIDEYYTNALITVEKAASSGNPEIIKSAYTESFVEITAKHIDGAYVVDMRDSTKKYKTVNDIIEGHRNCQKINNDKNAFMLKISNDLKAPLHSIIGFSQAIIDGLGGKISDKQEKYLRIINKNSSDLLYYYNQLMLLAETETKTFETDVKFFDIENAISAVIKTCEQLYPDKKVETLLETLENTKKTIYSDEKAFRLMFQTLFETILRSTDLGTIQVVLKNADEDTLKDYDLTNVSAIHIQIINNSNGILETEIPTLFNPYSVAETGNKRTITRAISLGSVKNIVQYLHGVIWAETEPLKGIIFNMIIPFEKDKNE